MLDGIRKVNRIDLGNVAIPDWIEGIASPEESIRKNPYDAIYDAHLDDLHELSSYIVPHLLGRLEEPGTNVGSKVMIEKIVSSLTDEQNHIG